MAKRFIDTDLWKKDFIRGLKGPYKLLWMYLTTDCNHAGIWECDFEVAQIKIGEKVEKAKAIEVFAGKIVVFDGGKKWFLPGFIDFQYGQLNPVNRAHTGVISLLRKYNLIEEDFSFKPLVSPLQGDKDMDMDKDKDMDIVIKEEKELKKYHAESVKLTDDEYSKLIFKYSTEELEWMLQKLNNYKLSSGKHYKSDYHALIGWVHEDAQKHFALNGGAKNTVKQSVSKALTMLQESEQAKLLIEAKYNGKQI